MYFVISPFRVFVILPVWNRESAKGRNPQKVKPQPGNRRVHKPDAQAKENAYSFACASGL